MSNVKHVRKYCQCAIWSTLWVTKGQSGCTWYHMAAQAGVLPSIQGPCICIHSIIQGMVKSINYICVIWNEAFCVCQFVVHLWQKFNLLEDKVIDTPVLPCAATKKVCELLAYTCNYLYNLNILALHFFTVYGMHGQQLQLQQHWLWQPTMMMDLSATISATTVTISNYGIPSNCSSNNISFHHQSTQYRVTY